MDVAPSTLAAEMPMMSPEEGTGPTYAEALNVYVRPSYCLCSAGKALSMYKSYRSNQRSPQEVWMQSACMLQHRLEPQNCELRASLTPPS